MLKNRRRREKFKENIVFKKLIFILLMLSLVSFVTYHLFLAINIANEKLQILEIAKEDVAELRIRNLELILEKSEVVSMEYIEKEARDKLRYTSEGDTVFVIPEELLNSDFVEEELEVARGSSKNEGDKTPEEVFQIWFDFLF